MPSIVYTPQYDIRAYGLEKLHPFDTRKYSRALARLERSLGPALRDRVIAPRRPASRDELLAVHTSEYLSRLGSSRYLAQVLEVPEVALVPATFIRHAVLRPMRWACAGTLLAGELAASGGFAVNLSGGYHHAKPDGGGGFCVYSDIALLIAHLRTTNVLDEDSIVAYVDVDAHQGNGVCHFFLEDDRVKILDMFNREIYPFHDVDARDRIDCPIPLSSFCTDERYLDLLRNHLTDFLDAISGSARIDLLVYNAGTDVLRGDPLGLLGVSSAGVVERDLLVARQAHDRGIPFVMLLSGGYTNESHKVIADSVAMLLQEFVGMKSLA